jgi:subtilisin-like proprotein convertase family protein
MNISYLYFDISGIKYFPFLSNHNWGENPIGRWKLRVETLAPQNIESKRSAMSYGRASEVGHFGLRMYGSNDPNDKNTVEQEKRQQKFAFVPSQSDLETIYKREMAARASVNILQKRDHQNLFNSRQVSSQVTNENQDHSFFGIFRRAFDF